MEIKKIISRRPPPTWSRTAKEMMAASAFKITRPGAVVYDVYRGAEKNKDKRKARRYNLRYDITYIYPGRLGAELSKTYGHYHNGDYPEIMEVLSGMGWFFLQRHGKKPENIAETYLVEAKKGEKIITPPGFGHLSINPSKNKILVLANWLGTKEKSDYGPYEKLRGGCYYIIRGKRGIIFKKNKKYSKVPRLIRLKPKNIPELGAVKSEPLYALIKNPEKLEFLNKPKKYKKFLTIENCYKKIS